MDEIDKQIVEILGKQGRLQWKELGEAVHLTGPAVAERVRRLEKQGIICGYQAVVDESKTGRATTALITIILSSGRHGEMQALLRSHPAVRESYRVSGDGCYWCRAVFAGQAELAAFLDELSHLGNYRLMLAVDAIR